MLGPSQSAELAARDKREDRAQLAREHMTALEPKLPRLAITVSSTGQARNLEIRVRSDGARQTVLGFGHARGSRTSRGS